MKIVVFEVEAWEEEGLAHLREDHELQLVEEPLRSDNASEFADAEIISTFIYSELGADVIDQLKDLRFIATRSTGFDHIALDRCRQRGITVSNVPSYGKNTVAEHVFALLLMISHNMEQAVDRTRKGDFSLRGLKGFDLYGRTMGVIGAGDIGRETIRIARGFGMGVLAYDIEAKQDLAEKLGFDYVEMDHLLAESDVISLHVPANEKTEGMIDDEAFGKMKDGVVLINTSRGALVRTKALIRALNEGRVAAAGLDVLPEEPVIREEAELLRSVYEERHNLDTLLADHVLVHMRNVIVTPHSAFKTREAVQRILGTTVENIQSFLKGTPRNAVVQPS